MFKLLTTKLAIVTAGLIAVCGIYCFPQARGYVAEKIFPAPLTVPAQEKIFSKDKIDLKIDSQCHYYNYDPTNSKSITEGELTGYFDAGCFFNNEPFGTWNEKDLCREKFFNFADLKPGDRGEDTISLHVYGRNACGVWEIYGIKDTGETCTEPETRTKDKDCKNKTPGAKEKNGELMENLEFKLWIDQGETVGFQGKDKDPLEGDNLWNGKDHLVFDWKPMDKCPQKMPLWYALRQIRKNNKDLCNAADRDGDGNTNYGACHGIARDGHLVKSATYYYGFAWRFPAEVGNEAQTDSLKFNMRFSVVPDDRCTACSNPCDSCNRNCSDCKDKCQDCIPEKCDCSR